MVQGFEVVAVLGAGTMGHGIAQVVAQAGSTVRLYDVEERFARAGLERIGANLAKGVEKGKLSAADREATLARLTAHADLAAAARGAALVIEAAPEKLELKQNLLSQCAAVAAPDAILATNTSSLSITRIASAIPRPERVVGLHFFNPVHLMELLEIVHGERTSPEIVERSKRFAAAIGKTPIVVRDAPGFASSRLGIAIAMEAIRMVESGVASAQDIDTAMKLGYRHPMGPLELTDHVGLDVRLAIAEYLHQELGAVFDPPALLRKLVAEGRLGKKSGRGFYEWK
ncbi:MAG: 3-hydroxyacyl-CoA dehydrogenase family protein [Planctomycetes bacterium]|nr:3-hydroxyacyl-CoA dehydrogenase family protein [Planctomycetota bacterium]